MKILTYILIVTLLTSCSTQSNLDKGFRYFDEKNKEISKSKFTKESRKEKYVSIKGDSVHHRKLKSSVVKRKINNRAYLQSLLEKEIGKKLESSKPLVIIYHPGTKQCDNRAEGFSKKEIKSSFFELKNNIKAIADIDPIHIYKNDIGLQNYDGIINWHKDPNGIIEKLFFEHHYPCSSFVVISREGEYISFFGESRRESLYEAIKMLSN